MSIIGKWKVKEFLLEAFGLKNYKADELPDTEEYEGFAKMKPIVVEITEDGFINDLMPLPDGVSKEELDEQGLTLRDDGYVVIASKKWKEENGRFCYDTEIEGEICGEAVDSNCEIEVTSDGCIIYSSGLILLERV